MGPDAMILIFWILSFKPNFSLSSFTFIKRLFRSSSFSAIRIVLVLIFLLEILIPACVSSSQAFCRMYSAYKLNKYGDNIQPWCTPISILNQSVLCSKFSLIIYFVHNINSAGVAFYDYIFFWPSCFGSILSWWNITFILYNFLFLMTFSWLFHLILFYWLFN